ncbi:hypothetical protein D3C80_1597930 [compost metagenome]
MHAVNSVHDQVVKLFIILHQFDHHQGALHIFGGRMDGGTVLCRDGDRFFLALVDIGQRYFVR